jgi:hypothetical protein
MITAETLIGVSISILYISRTIGLYRDTLCLRPRSKRNIFLRKAWQFAKMKKWSIYSESQRQSWVASQHNAWFQSYLTADHDIPRSRLLKTQYVSIVSTVNFDHFTQPKPKSRPSVSVRCIIGWEITSHFYE